jgi:outer membrane protein
MKLLKIIQKFTICTAIILISYSNTVFSQYAPIKIGYVSLERILNESKMAKEAQLKMQNDFGAREKDVRDGVAKIKAEAAQLDKDALVIPEVDRIRRQRELAEHDREIQRKQRELIEDTQRRGAEERSKIFEKANQVLKSLVEQKKLDIVIQEAAFVSSRVDITNEVIAALNSK